MCVFRYLEISLVLLNFSGCNFEWWFETTSAFNVYPCDASEMSRKTLNNHLKFFLCFISCHIYYRKNETKNFIMVIKVKLLISKASNSCFKGFDFFQILLASHN